MEVKTLIVRNDQKLFENRCKEFLDNGWKLHTSNLLQDIPVYKFTERIQTSVDYLQNKNIKEFYFYALFIKE